MGATLDWTLLTTEEKESMSLSLQMETIQKRAIDARKAASKLKQVARRQIANANKDDAVQEMLSTLQASDDLQGRVFINRTDVNYVPHGREKEDLVVYINVSDVDKPVRVFLYSANATVKVSEVSDALNMYYTRIDESKCHAQQSVMTGVEFKMVARLLHDLDTMHVG
jgi:MoxR-like ATPase